MRRWRLSSEGDELMEDDSDSDEEGTFFMLGPGGVALQITFIS